MDLFSGFEIHRFMPFSESFPLPHPDEIGRNIILLYSIYKAKHNNENHIHIQMVDNKTLKPKTMNRIWLGFIKSIHFSSFDFIVIRLEIHYHTGARLSAPRVWWAHFFVNKISQIGWNRARAPSYYLLLLKMENLMYNNNKTFFGIVASSGGTYLCLFSFALI